jgi:hypothetical protein
MLTRRPRDWPLCTCYATCYAAVRLTPARERADGDRAPPLLVAVAKGRVMRITPEHVLSAGFGIVVALFVIAAVLA